MGFAVLSSDAGHAGSLGPTFGIDPQARLDYGYQAVGTLTPMAKSLVQAAYGRMPDRSYMTGGSNGGRHTMVGAARYADQYDGFLAVAPGFNLPQAAVAQLWGAQQWARVATSTADLSTALTLPERQVLAGAILARCDGIDRLEDGMVQDSDRCQKAFSVDRDVPTCAADRDGTCLTTEQKAVVSAVFAGARTSTGEEIYSSFPYDPGLVQSGWASWKFVASLTRDPGAVGFIFGTPPNPGIAASPLTVDIDAATASIYATSGIYTESGMQFMTPPNPTQLDTLRQRGGKMIVVHGASDGVFSPDDTASWYDELDARYRQKAGQFVRYFEVPGMGHVRGGPATDQYAGLSALIDWVEHGSAPRADRRVGEPGQRRASGGVERRISAARSARTRRWRGTRREIPTAPTASRASTAEEASAAADRTWARTGPASARAGAGPLGSQEAAANPSTWERSRPTRRANTT